MYNILIVDKDPATRRLYELTIKKINSNYNISSFGSVEDLYKFVKKSDTISKFKVLFLNVPDNRPRQTYLYNLERLKLLCINLKVVGLCDYSYKYVDKDTVKLFEGWIKKPVTIQGFKTALDKFYYSEDTLI